MRIDIIVDERATRNWQVELAMRLKDAGHVAAFQGAPGAAVHAGLGLLEGLERKLYRLDETRPGGVAARGKTKAFAAPAEAAELVIDTVGVSTHMPRLVLRCDDHAGECSAVAALLKRQAPMLSVELVDETASLCVAQALPGLEEPHIFSRSFDRVCQRMSDILFQACMDHARCAAQGKRAADVHAPRSTALFAAAGFAIHSLADRIVRKIVSPLAQDEHWRVGWRMAQGDGVDQRLAWPMGDFHFLPDDSRRFFADPFGLHRDGVTHVLCEEFPYATRKGVISHFTIDAAGKASPTRVVLERPYHLSYPFLFCRDGDVFMIPETAANGRVELYRADPFPDVWKLERVLIENVRLNDATLIERDGLFWLFGTLTDGARSTWDALGLYFAESLEGPWRAHPGNPVLIDAGCARPAGAMFEFGGELMRPAQDCRGGYGVGFALCRIDRLDPEGFAQSVVRRFTPPPAWGEKGLHTLNRAGPVELVDTKGWLRK